MIKRNSDVTRIILWRQSRTIYWGFCTQMDWHWTAIFQPKYQTAFIFLEQYSHTEAYRLGNVAWPGSYQPLPLGSLPLPSPPLPGFLQSFVLSALLKLPGFLQVGCSVSHDFTSDWFKTIALLWSEASQKLAEAPHVEHQLDVKRGKKITQKKQKKKQNQILPQLVFSWSIFKKGKSEERFFFCGIAFVFHGERQSISICDKSWSSSENLCFYI